MYFSGVRLFCSLRHRGQEAHTGRAHRYSQVASGGTLTLYGIKRAHANFRAGLYQVVGPVVEESNDYFAIRNWP